MLQGFVGMIFANSSLTTVGAELRQSRLMSDPRAAVSMRSGILAHSAVFVRGFAASGLDGSTAG